jgi:DNA-binding XRE family transcriptional regulator
MVDRIKKIMEESGWTPSTFADFIGINRATMSQTLVRNQQASIKVVLQILDKYPQINPEWLLLGKEPMYKGEKPSLEPVLKPKNLFDSDDIPDNHPKSPATPKNSKETIDKQEEILPKIAKTQSFAGELSISENIDKIVIFFKNKTYITLKPEE